MDVCLGVLKSQLTCYLLWDNLLTQLVLIQYFEVFSLQGVYSAAHLFLWQQNLKSLICKHLLLFDKTKSLTSAHWLNQRHRLTVRLSPWYRIWQKHTCKQHMRQHAGPSLRGTLDAHCVTLKFPAAAAQWRRPRFLSVWIISPDVRAQQFVCSSDCSAGTMSWFRLATRWHCGKHGTSKLLTHTCFYLEEKALEDKRKSQRLNLKMGLTFGNFK